MNGRELTTQKEVKSHPCLWFLASYLQLQMVAGGLYGFVVTGLSLKVDSIFLVCGILLLSLGITFFYYVEKLNGYRMYLGMGILVLYALLIFVTQDSFINGAVQLADGCLRSMNRRYESSLAMLSGGYNPADLTLFLVEIAVPLIFWTGACCVYRPDMLNLSVLLLPVAAVVLLCGGEPSAAALFVLLFGVLSLAASSRSVRKKRMWGEKKSERFRKNLTAHKNIQKKAAVLICGAGMLLSVVSFYLVKPVLSLQLEKAETITAKAEGRMMEALIDLLPAVSAGKLNLRVETPGGGVADGALGDMEGYSLQNVEDLKVISTGMPEETIYLKGFVGSGYTGDHWLETDGDAFEDAASNWKTEENPGLYIQNLPFLRCLYIDNENGTSGMQQLTVERINANSRYTYYPYNSFLNEFYQVQAGDGYVAGQEEQDDIFSWYSRSMAHEMLSAWKEDDEKKSVLDRVEASYSAFVKNTYLDVPDGFEELKEECSSQEIKEGDTDAAIKYIKSYFADNFTFSMDVSRLPEGEDFVRYFLYETRTGYSTHYASAATLMFRMFGIPSRYVVGYAAPRNLFTAQPDGTYTAVLQGDNAHAWTEIYVEGEGWMPVETTPGTLGTAEDVEYIGEKVTNEGTPQEEEEQKENQKETEENQPDAVWKSWFRDNLESIIHIFSILLLTACLLFVSIRWIRKRWRVLGLNRKKSPEKRIRDIFRAIYEHLVKIGLNEEIESGSEEFVRFVQKSCPQISREEYEHMMQLVQESCYSDEKITEKDVIFIRKMYQKIGRHKRKSV